MTQLAPEPSVIALGPLTATLLEHRLRAVEPSVVLAPLWLLQNLIAQERGTGGSPFTVPHRRILVIERGMLQKQAADADLPLPANLPDASTLILLSRPDPEWLDQTPPDQALRYYWKLLFHARVDMEMHRKLSEATLACGPIETRIERIGRSAFNEAKFVLQRERYLAPGGDNRDAYAEFTAVFCELNHFRPDLLETYFPAIKDHAAVLSSLNEDVDSTELLRQTRPEGAADAVFVPVEPDVHDNPAEEAIAREDLKQLAAHDAQRAPALLAKAATAAARGNAVRAGILRMRVFRATRDADAIQNAMQDLDGLVQRLRAALYLDEGATQAWSGALIPLLAHAAGGWWNPEGRLLYDLQKVCVGHEREIYSVGVVEWLLEFRCRPLVRPQPNQREVLKIEALRSAIDRLPKTRLASPQRTALHSLLHDALHHAEEQLRETVRPAIIESLKAGGIHPHTAVERVAEAKLTEELLDGLVHRGYINMGNLRDTISRNQIKLHDLRGFKTWFGSDQLLRIDRHLSDTLDGVYHRGEIYLRFFQRLSSPFFGTEIGRTITRTLIMPVLGSFLILAALDHTLFLLLRKITGWHWITLSRFESEEHRSIGQFLMENKPFIILAFVLLGVINWPAFRRLVGRALVIIGRALRSIFYEIPRWVLTQPAVVAVLASRPVRLAGRFLVKPLIFAGLTYLLLPHKLTRSTRLSVAAGVFVIVNLLLNSATGRAVEQAILHWLRVSWTRVTGDILGNLFRGIMHFFERMLERLDRMLYAVDEWLRFRSGQSRVSLYSKAVMGVFWFYIAYFVRFATNLLAEPQINPIKHVPVVTVSHKIIFPQVGVLASALEKLGMRQVRAGTMAFAIVTVIPGIFGFLAWELKENWKLYRANRAANLKPVPVGSHGESMARLLRPGLHSGTVPKIFAKLRRARRRAERPALAERARAATAKQIEHAEHVCEGVKYFVHRELAALLNQHSLWQSTPLSVGEVTLSASRIEIELECDTLGEMATIAFEQREGWIMAEIEHVGWMQHVSAEQRHLLSIALLGLYKISGVDIIKEQIEAAFGSEDLAFELSNRRLFVWPTKAFDREWIYELNTDEAQLVSTDPTVPPVKREQIFLQLTTVPWSQWVHTWDGSKDVPPMPNITVLAS